MSSQFCLPHVPKRGSSPGVSAVVAVHLQDAARAELEFELGVLRIVGVLRLVLGIEVIEIAEELVEAMHGRQELVAVAEMVLAELSGHVAERLEQIGERRVLVRQPFFGSRQPDLEQAGAHRALAGDERGAAGGAGLLAVIVGEDRAFVGDAVDVGRAIAHHAAVVGADVPVADVVAHDDEDVRLGLLCDRPKGEQHHRELHYERRQGFPSHVLSFLLRTIVKSKNVLPIVLHADDDPTLLCRLAVQGLGEGADFGVGQPLRRERRRIRASQSSCNTSIASRAPSPPLVYSNICRSPVELPNAA